MSSTKASVDELRELREAKNDDDALSSETTEERKPVVGLLMAVVGVALMVLSFLLPS